MQIRMTGRRGFLRKAIGLLATMALATASSVSLAADFPASPLTLIVPYGAGGPTDTLLRALAKQASEVLGQPIVVDNRPGANGVLGAAALARAKDDYTIAMLPGTVFREPHVTQVAYDAEQLSYIIGLTDYVFGLAVRADAPWKDWGAFAAEAAKQPGKLTIGVSGATGTPRIVFGEITDAAGLKVSFVPYKGDSEVVPDLLGGHLDAAVLTGAAVQYIESGRMRYLAMLTAERTERSSEVPTFRELGLNFVADSPFGLAGRPGMPAEHVKVLHDAFKVALESSEVKAVLSSLNQPLNYMSPEVYTAYAKKALAREAGRVEYLRRQGLLN